MQKKRKLKLIRTPKKRLTVKKMLYAVLMAAAAFLLLQAGLTYARSVIAAKFVNIVISEEGVLEAGHIVRGIIVRDEKVVAAPITGVLHWKAAEGARLPAGAAAAYIAADDGTRHPVLTPRPGIVVTRLDGLEGLLRPQALPDLNVESIYAYAGQPEHRKAEGDNVRQGTILFKMVDNFSWYFALKLSEEEFAAMAEVKNVMLRFPFAPQDEVAARRRSTYEQKGMNTIILEVREDLPGFFAERFTSAEIISRTGGIVLPGSALVMRGEERGVYVLENSVVRFRPVEVLKVTGNEMAVTGIGSGFRVIANPILVREGMRI